MPSSQRRALGTLSILALSIASGPGCVTTHLSPPILAALDCASLIPPSYRQPVPSIPLPGKGLTVGELAVALDGQTARLDQANGRMADVVAIADTCQARQAAVLKELVPSKPWWAVWRTAGESR